jgi:hypothetical protein
MGNTCPRIANIPAIRPIQGIDFCAKDSKTKGEHRTGTRPFSISRIITSIKIFFPSSLPAFVAPIFLDPDSRRSTPFIHPINRPKGIAPTR